MSKSLVTFFKNLFFKSPAEKQYEGYFQHNDGKQVWVGKLPDVFMRNRRVVAAMERLQEIGMSQFAARTDEYTVAFWKTLEKRSKASNVRDAVLALTTLETYPLTLTGYEDVEPGVAGLPISEPITGPVTWADATAILAVIMADTPTAEDWDAAARSDHPLGSHAVLGRSDAPQSVRETAAERSQNATV